MNQILCIALALLVGLLSTRLMKVLKLPNVTGFLLAGIAFGPFALGQFFGWGASSQIASETSALFNLNVNSISWISDIALGFIAFTIGCSFKIKSLKQVGKRVVVITIFEALGGAIFAILGLFIAYIFMKDYLSISSILTLGAIACATAPAATLLVIKQYKARGPVVNTLIPVVAFDDAIALVMFAILFALSKALVSDINNINIMDILVMPSLEIVVSLAMGLCLGLLVALACKVFKSRSNRMIAIIVAILIVVGLSIWTTYDAISYQTTNEGIWVIGGSSFTISPLLACMMIGAMFINLRKDAEPTLGILDKITPPLYMLFFVISGASLKLDVFWSKEGIYIAIIAITYVVFRAIGKCIGSFSAAKITKAEPAVQKYLGFTLLPQAGVAIGLATTASNSFASKEGAIVLATILTATIIYEILGPIITKIALTKAKEIVPETKTREL